MCDLSCSTPFGIRGFNILFAREAELAHCAVLNAFRHQRVQHLGRLPRQLAELGCSTPFGIRGFNIRNTDSHAVRACRAQRLSASEGSTYRTTGISDRRRNVLNAFRHQRVQHCGKTDCTGSVSQCSTPFGIRGFNISRWTPTRYVRSGAQRLSASEGSTYWGLADYLNRSQCAQRLSASEGST